MFLLSIVKTFRIGFKLLGNLTSSLSGELWSSAQIKISICNLAPSSVNKPLYFIYLWLPFLLAGIVSRVHWRRARRLS